ncbi:NADPH-dependent FMN reductase [Actinomadura rayongensis]|uniref:NADPH-dependent FMN reductase n=1 Tax=Actinomadura rayongensis TaxID=1429076 RepID=A0A6I4W3L9_9ACTN|nr:NAD(P)H-dependent oxidoreductase [Actinomadura rayongensis]MXQ63025.1 NADPH-dependent FMN reductase [Actinomadura rayongensis]
MSADRLRLGIIVGSMRDGRLGPTVARWIAAEAERDGEFDLDVIDLREADLPVVTPDFGADPEPAVAARRDALGERLDAADAFVVVTPEYNHGAPAGLKSAIDWFLKEWQAKPVAFVSYGGISGGLRAVEHLRQVFAEVHATTIRETVSFHDAWSHWDTQGNWPKDPERANAAAKVMLVQLAWWARALKDAKQSQPYPG